MPSPRTRHGELAFNQTSKTRLGHLVKHNHGELFRAAGFAICAPATIVQQLGVVTPLTAPHHVCNRRHQITIHILFVGDFFIAVQHAINVPGVMGRYRLLDDTLCVLLGGRALTELATGTGCLRTQIYGLGRITAGGLHVVQTGGIRQCVPLDRKVWLKKTVRRGLMFMVLW